MLGKIKGAIQDRLYKNCIEEYQKELHYQTDPYLFWVKENEEDIRDEAYPNVEVVYMEDCDKNFSLHRTNKEYLIFASRQGKIAQSAFYEILQYFATHEDVNIVYADEDVWMVEETEKIQKELKKRSENLKMQEHAHRIFPWTKPMWSPDTLFSFLYFGNIFAVRRSSFLEIEWLGDEDYKKNIYDFVLKATERERRPGHIEKILFHAYQKGKDRADIEKRVMHETNFIGVGRDYDFIRISAMTRRGWQGTMVEDKETGISYPIYELEKKPLVSIIIPSKDHAEIVKRCIRSVYEHTTYPNYELIVVDNGSEQKTKTQLEAFCEEYPFTYLYQPMEFNFSRMCNMGVQAAKGKYILLLNDDMEVVEDLWLTRMVGHASLKHVGAVGAKLLYPNSTLIQHAGVTNTLSGPGHKLKLHDDGKSYYYGRNRFIYDMIGVTAACLLMRKDRFLAVGGLFEGLAVAYNDVDLCFRLCDKGLYNVQRNDVVLYHHESLSRGDDLKDEKKLERLENEKTLLYKRHTKLYQKDPFIGTLMNNGENEYVCRWLEGYEVVNMFACDKMLAQGKKLPSTKSMNQAILIVLEDCGKEKFAKAIARNGKEKKSYYLIKGWAYVPGMDNARYQFKILLIDDNGKVWELPVQKRYRKDVASILPDETNVELTGFCSWIFDGTLPAGTYDLWMTAKDGCSRQRLYRSMERQLVID